MNEMNKNPNLGGNAHFFCCINIDTKLLFREAKYEVLLFLIYLCNANIVMATI